MGKAEFNSPKGIANRIKSKGLQKLKFFCQMCQKQCRDANGFKCHCLSESHQRQMSIFAENPDKFLDVFSESFEEGYLELLQRRYNTRRINANQVYNEYIQDKEHVHMNSTIWSSLGDFVKYLGRTGKCVIEETDKGWHVTWINRDPKLLARAAAHTAREEAELDDAARHEKELEEMAAAARAAALAELFNDDDDDGEGDGEVDASVLTAPAYTALLRESAAAAAPVRISLGSAAGTAGSGSSAPSLLSSSLATAGAKRKRFDVEGDDVDGVTGPTARGSHSSSGAALSSAAPLSAAARLIQEDLRLKAKVGVPTAGGTKPSRFDNPGATSSLSGSRGVAPVASEPPPEVRMGGPSDCWVAPGIVVKVLNSAVGGGAFYKKKAVVTGPAPDSPYVGVLRMLDGSGAVLKVDQQQLETVLPSPGGTVLVLSGAHRGRLATLVAIDEAAFSATVRMQQGSAAVVTGLEYEHLCKYDPGAR